MRILLVVGDAAIARSIALMLKSEDYVVDLTDMGEDEGAQSVIAGGSVGHSE